MYIIKVSVGYWWLTSCEALWSFFTKRPSFHSTSIASNINNYDAFCRDIRESITANANTFFGRVASKVLSYLGLANVVDAYGPNKGNTDKNAFPTAVAHVFADLGQAYAFAASLLDTYKELRQEYNKSDTRVRESCRLRELNYWKQYAIVSGQGSNDNQIKLLLSLGHGY